MTHQLDGCFVKLDGADTHLDALKGTVDGLIGPEPDLLPGEFNPDSGQYVFRAQRDMRVPLPVSAVIGDVVHNLYTALDYLACELVIVNRQSVTSRTAFPIFQTRGAYDDPRSGAPPKIAGMHRDAQALIQQLQPFHRPDLQHPSEHPLAVLYALEQWDKHHALNAVSYAAGGRLHGRPDTHYPPGLRGFRPGAYERGAVLATYTPLPGEPQVNMHFEIAHQIAFDVHGPAGTHDVLEGLNRIREHIRCRVLPRFRQFFP
jgi:hypothetical protein